MTKRLDETPTKAGPTRTILVGGPTPGTPPNPGGATMGAPVSIANVNDPRWARRWTRILLSKVGSIFNAVRTDVVGAVALNQFNPETLYPDELLVYGSDSLVQIAAHASCVGLEVLAASPFSLVIEQLWAWRQNTAGQISINYGPGVLTGGINPLAISSADTRSPGTVGVGSTAQIRFTANQDMTSPNGVFLSLPSGIFAPVPLIRPFIMVPGTSMLLTPTNTNGSNTQNEGIGVAVFGRLRAGNDPT